MGVLLLNRLLSIGRSAKHKRVNLRLTDYIGGSEVSPQSSTLNIMAIVKVLAHDTPEIVYAPRFVGSEVPEFESARIRLSGAYEYVIEINPPSASQVAATCAGVPPRLRMWSYLNSANGGKLGLRSQVEKSATVGAIVIDSVEPPMPASFHSASRSNR